MKHHSLSVQQIYLALLSGVLFMAAFPKFGLSVLAWAGMIPLFFALRNAPPRSSFFLGWICGLFYFGGTLYWIVQTMSVYGHVALWQSLLISMALISYLSSYIGAFAFLLNWLRRIFPAAVTLLSAPFIWTSLELIRSHFLTGFPWSTLGYTQYAQVRLIQFSDITGVYGVSFLIILVNSCLAVLLEHVLAGKEKKTAGTGRETGRKMIKISSTICVTLILIAAVSLVEGYGGYKLYSRKLQPAQTLNVGIVQGNIPQEAKWNDHMQDEVYGYYQSLTLQIAQMAPDLIIWPETSAPFINEQRGNYLDRISPLAQQAKVPLLVGSPRLERGERGKITLKNSAFFLSPQGEIWDYYDKIHLVPFGEYLPLGWILSHLGSVVNEVGEFSAGERYTIFHLDRWRFGLVICYEIIFPDLFRKFARQGVDFMVNITNDAWFDRSSAPYQHFSMAVFRAIENGVSVVRVANTGISGIIDPFGEISVETPLSSRLALVRPLELNRGDTFYVRHGDLFAQLCLFVLGFWLILGYYKTYQTKKLEG
ncbi:MAG: apolipoprotein N-acyltransferase [bacterium]